MARNYRKKHFYEITWTNSNGWCPEGGAEHLFCIVGYEQPTCEEAEVFLDKKMDEWGYDTVSNVREISKEEAMRDFNGMDKYQNMRCFSRTENVWTHVENLIDEVINDELAFEKDFISNDGWKFLEEQAPEIILEKIKEDDLDEQELGDMEIKHVRQYLNDIISEYEENHAPIRVRSLW